MGCGIRVHADNVAKEGLHLCVNEIRTIPEQFSVKAQEPLILA